MTNKDESEYIPFSSRSSPPADPVLQQIPSSSRSRPPANPVLQQLLASGNFQSLLAPNSCLLQLLAALTLGNAPVW
ncbi:hypothetical protein J6590_065975 [Homalodisca vitripennis]|nr:hypothetical protein J6590_065975 [Homalodisca vitripennis]